MTNKKASVIVTSYNKPEYLKRAIESCLIQDYANLEIIIADDNSPNPDVWNVINSYSDQRIISFNSLIRDEDRLKTARYATQINLAVREYSTGEYLFYLADDDYFYPKMITKMIEYGSRFDYDVCFCAQHIVDTSGNIDGGGIEGRGVRFFPEVLTRGADKLDHNQVMTSRKSFYDVGGWNDEPWCWSGADAAFYDRLEKAGYLFYPIDTNEPLQAKMYRENSIQWNMTNGLSPTGEQC